MSVTPRNPDIGPSRGTPMAALMEPPSHEFTLAEMNGAVSRLTGLSPELAEVARLAGNLLGPVNNNPTLRAAGLNSAGVASYIAQHISSELREKMEPGRRADVERLARLNPNSAEFAALQAKMGLGLLGLPGSSFTREAGSGGTNGKPAGGYQTMAYGTAQSLQGVNPTNFGATPFAQAGLDFRTLDNLRKYDRNFTGHDIINAAQNAKKLGFDPKDQRAMRNQATIEHYDNKKEDTNAALRRYKQLMEGDQELSGWIKQSETATPEQKKELEAKIKARRGEHVEKSGVKTRVEDPGNHPKARKAIPDTIRHLDEQQQKQLQQQFRQNPNVVDLNKTEEEDKKRMAQARLTTQRDTVRQNLRSAEPAEQAPQVAAHVADENEDIIKKMMEARTRQAQATETPAAEQPGAKMAATPKAEPGNSTPAQTTPVETKTTEATPTKPTTTATAKKPGGPTVA